MNRPWMHEKNMERLTAPKGFSNMPNPVLRNYDEFLKLLQVKLNQIIPAPLHRLRTLDRDRLMLTKQLHTGL
jgi:hypothetical protein